MGKAVVFVVMVDPRELDLQEVVSTHSLAESASPSKRPRADCETCPPERGCSCVGTSSLRFKAVRPLPSADSEIADEEERRSSGRGLGEEEERRASFGATMGRSMDSAESLTDSATELEDDDPHIQLDGETRSILEEMVVGAAMEASWQAMWRRPSAGARGSGGTDRVGRDAAGAGGCDLLLSPTTPRECVVWSG